MNKRASSTELLLAFAVVLFSIGCVAHGQIAASPSNVIHGDNLTVEGFEDGSYALRSASIPGDVLRAEVEVDTADGILKSSLYPQHLHSTASFTDELGSGHLLTVTHAGLAGKPELVCEFRVYGNQPWGGIQVTVVNSTGKPIEIRSIRVLKSTSGSVLSLNGPAEDNRILSDSFSEDPGKLMDFCEPKNGVHRAFGSQLIYNRKSGQGFFVGALSADRFLTVFHLVGRREPYPQIVSYDIADGGTTEALGEQNSNYPAGNSVPLRIQVLAGKSVKSERLMFAIGRNYHKMLENYGQAIRVLHRAPVSIPTPIGWWSWTAYYYGVTEGAMLTNASWLAQNLASIGYSYFQVDEGYQYTRGEYATADGAAFPRGMAYVGDQVGRKGLVFGLWVAPFQVSERSWVYQRHQDWLVHDLAGKPIHVGKVGGKFDELYALDTTNPGAQEYLRMTYRTLVNDWGTRFIKMDFMETTAVEGNYYRPNTSALEAQRIGLEIIRSVVGDDVVLDKDGSPMLTPVGIVNTGRISEDTGHTFESTRDAATGVAGRYYMNRNFYVSDPDAFTVSKQIIPDRGWHGNKVPLTMDEAEASIALSAVSGGMFEIGDDLPALGSSPERVALVKNSDLLDMARLGKASVPIDLMTYRSEDKQPSVFLLDEDRRQKIISVFNWTEETRNHTLDLEALGLKGKGTYTAINVLKGGVVPIGSGKLTITLPPHSVRMLKLTDSSVPDVDPVFEVHAPLAGQVGDCVGLHASAGSTETPVLGYRWQFGDDVSADGADVCHAYTQSGQYTLTVTVTGLNGHMTQKKLSISVTGIASTEYNPEAKKRYIGAR
jgi:hypothetical protein